MTSSRDLLIASLQPGGAGARALEALRLREEGRLTFAEIGTHFGVSRERARQLVAQGTRIPARLRQAELIERQRTPERLRGVSVKTANALRRAGITRPEQVKTLTDNELLRLPWIGRGSVAEIRAATKDGAY
jgi:hypothetical protein